MRGTSSNWPFVVLYVAIIALCGWLYTESRRPMPAPLLRAAGPIAGIDVRTGRHGRLDVKWWLRDREQPFWYDAPLHGTRQAADALRAGRWAEVLYVEPPSGHPELWGLRVDGQVILTPAAAYEARRLNGRWALGVLVVAVIAIPILLVGGRAWAAEPDHPGER